MVTTRASRAREVAREEGKRANYVSRAVCSHLVLLAVTLVPYALQNYEKLPSETKPYTFHDNCFGAGTISTQCIIDACKANLATIWTSVILIITASAAVYAGSWRSVKPSTVTEEEKPVAMSKADAMRFPLMGSVVLLGLFAAIKLLPKELLTVCLSLYFVLLGTFAITATVLPFVDPWVPGFIRRANISLGFLDKLPKVVKDFLLEADEAGDFDLSTLKITGSELICGLGSAALCYWYYMSKHWVSNNAIGISFCVQGIEMLSLGSVDVGIILLCGLFLYDIFWVFFTPVMVTVAKSFDAPIKLLFIRSLSLEDGAMKPQFSMLGLGDIVIPGIYIALLLRMDHKRGFDKSNYFGPVFVSYILGLVATLVVMNVFQHAQPALLYLVPACLGSTFLVALMKGEVRFIFNWTEVDQSAEKKEK